MSSSILLVEDDRELRATLHAALEVEGYRVFAAASLADAHALLAHAAQPQGIDLVLLDLGLPDGDGQSLLSALRHRGHAVSAAITRYEREGLTIDVAAHRVTLHDTPVHLTPTEFKLLARLLRNAGQVVTHRALLADVWGADFTDHTHYLRLYMAQLRAKLEADPAQPQRLLTEPGVGYRLVEPDA